jgi:hypothetical protein
LVHGVVVCLSLRPCASLASPSLQELDFHRIIGTGQFGLVRVVSHKVTREVYALKVRPQEGRAGSPQRQSDGSLARGRPARRHAPEWVGGCERAMEGVLRMAVLAPLAALL